MTLIDCEGGKHGKDFTYEPFGEDRLLGDIEV